MFSHPPCAFHRCKYLFSFQSGWLDYLPNLSHEFCPTGHVLWALTLLSIYYILLRNLSKFCLEISSAIYPVSISIVSSFHKTVHKSFHQVLSHFITRIAFTLHVGRAFIFRSLSRECPLRKQALSLPALPFKRPESPLW